MSLHGLMSGAECAVEVNPLHQVLKHADADRGAQQDRIAGPSGSRLHHLPTSAAPGASAQDLAHARQFFGPGAQAQAPGLAASPEHAARMAHEFARALDAAKGAGAPPPSLASAWTDGAIAPYAGWAGEFDSMGGQAAASVPSQQQQQLQQPAQPGQQQRAPYMYNNASYGAGMYGGMGMGMAQYMPQQPAQFAAQDKGKGKLREADYEAAFAQVHAALAPQTESRIEEVTDALAAAALGEPQEQEGTAIRAEGPFKEIWDQMQNSDMPPPAEDLAKWEAEFNQLMRAENEEPDYDYGGTMKDVWENGYNAQRDASLEPQYDEEGIPALSPYVFEQQNQYLDPSASRSCLEDAKALLAQGGSLTEAALLLEAAIQRGELGKGGYEAWILLGETRNMDEREEAGLRALREGTRLAAATGVKGEGMISLAISYTNEGFDRASHATLFHWMRAVFPEFPVHPDSLASLKQSAWHSRDMVTEALLRLARIWHMDGARVNADLQIALGVLFYTAQEFDRARDCFETALGQRPDDWLLWNRLGSSLSNGNKPEESLGAYRQALALRPTYTRAIYNVGVACLNIGAHKEAAEHFLSALSLQESKGDKSEQLLSTLRRAFAQMNRVDLAEKVVPGVDLGMFRAEGFEF